MNRLSSLLNGAVLGALLTAPLMGVFYLAEQAFGLPFPPFDFFDWLARTLPGDVVVRSIEAMVDLIRRFDLGETSGTAKTLERLSALAIFFGGGVLAGAALFSLARYLTARRRTLRAAWPGALAGVLVSIPLIAISLNVRGATPHRSSRQDGWRWPLRRGARRCTQWPCVCLDHSAAK
ncbi:MAG: hypothetical protein KatS3mg051_0815 [Anaerolineae bacterium]|nr:MAG: hypothetical protein KatS3mg051_0815 [Anaerolineae bacterium]